MPVGRASDTGNMLRIGSVGAVGVNGSSFVKAIKQLWRDILNN
jgi:hypothetical protein